MNTSNYRVIERPDFPEKTIVAPFLLARELRMQLRGTDLNVHSGTDSAVHVSVDLAEAYDAWSSQNDTDQ